MNLRSSKVLRLLVSLSLINIFVTSAPAVAATIGSTPCVSQIQDASKAAMTSSGGYCYLVFKEGSNSWTVPAGVNSSSILIIGGGGAGGGGAWGAGGGAGGIVYDSAYPLTSGSTYSLVVGGGGAAGGATLSISTNASSSGSDSWFYSNNSLVAKGGGAGASYSWGQSAGALCQGRSGGSGGGSTECNDGSTNTGGASTQTIPSGADAVYGFAGGSTPSANYYSGAGGGGAGQAGTAVTAAASPGKGGNGTNAFSSWLTIITSSMADISGWSTATSSGYIAGGGGGASKATPGGGGTGGGGAGGTDVSTSTLNGNPGTPGTGSGGGGGTYNGNCGVGGAGGSGLLVIKYQVSDSTPPSFSNVNTFSVSENISASTNAAIIKVNESSTITIDSGTDSSAFTVVSVDSITAGIRFVSSPNFESPTDSGSNNIYDITVRATDASGNYANQSISITIANVNEAPTINNNSSSATYSISQSENISSVVTFSASDVDSGSSLSFSLSGTDALDFTINASSGVLAFIANPDFEAPVDSDLNNIYIVIVTVSDGTLTDTQTVTISITNLNEVANIGEILISNPAYKGVPINISVSVNVSGIVRFLVNGKRISQCIATVTSGTYPSTSATCSWKPSVSGRQSLTATISPTDVSFSGATSNVKSVVVLRRATLR